MLSQYIKNLSIPLVAFTLMGIYPHLSEAQTFRQAKDKLSRSVYADHKISFYCGCDYELQRKPNGKGKRLTPDWQSCGFKPRKQAERASRIEWEHVMPVHHFGQHMQCWRNGGRKACKNDPLFSKLAGDMHNLVPAIGEVNGNRSNFKFGMIAGENRLYGQCDAEVDFKARRFEPKESVRGDIARTYFYMAYTYKVRLSKQQIQLFKSWSKMDPVDRWERLKNQRIEKLQGNLNPYIQ